MRFTVLVICLLLAASAATATTYKWEDAKGVHYADELGAVPGELRPRALPEDDNGVITFSRPAPFNTISAQRQKNLAESERAERARDRIVMEAIRQHQEEIIRGMSRDTSALQAHLVRLFSHRLVVWIVPLLLLLFFWGRALREIIRCDITPPARKYRWLLIVLLLGPFGTGLYYLRDRPRKAPPAPDHGVEGGSLSRLAAQLKRFRKGKPD